MAVKVNIGKLELNGSLKAIKNYIDEKGIHLLEFDGDDLDIAPNFAISPSGSI